MKSAWRILGRVGLLLLVMIALLWLLGGRTYSWTSDMQTTAQPARLFACLTEPDLITQWMEAVVSIEPETDFGSAIGARNKMLAKDEGGEYYLEDEILAYEQDQLLRVRIDSPNLSVTSTYSIEPYGEWTRLHRQSHAQYKGVSRLLAPFLGTRIQEQLERDLRNLQELAESAPMSRETQASPKASGEPNPE